MPAIKSHKLGWDGVAKGTLFDPEPGFRWVKFSLRYPGRPDRVTSSHRVPENATPEQIRAAIVEGCKIDPEKAELQILEGYTK